MLPPRGEKKMEGSKAQKLVRVLKILVTIVFVCNLAALAFVPGLVLLGSDGSLTEIMAHADHPIGAAAALCR